MFKEFRTFILRGNVIDLAVGLVIGGAFGAIVTSFVSDVLMPPIGLLLGQVDFQDLFVVLREGTAPGPYPTAAAAKEAGAVTLNYGLFVNTLIGFLIIGFSVFLVVRAVNRLHVRVAPAPPPPPPARECPYCLSAVAPKATRCPHCTSELSAS